MPSEQDDRRTDQWIAHLVHKGHMALQAMQQLPAVSRQLEPTQAPQQQLQMNIQRGPTR